MNKNYGEYKKLIDYEMAEHARSHEQIEHLLRTGNTITKAIAMFNPLITTEISNKLDKLKNDKNEIIRYDAEYIEKEQLLALNAHSIDFVADKKAEEEKQRKINYKKFLRTAIN